MTSPAPWSAHGPGEHGGRWGISDAAGIVVGNASSAAAAQAACLIVAGEPLPDGLALPWEWYETPESPRSHSRSVRFVDAAGTEALEVVGWDSDPASMARMWSNVGLLEAAACER